MSQIRVQCNSCATELSLPATAAGKNGRCPKCQTVFAIPAISTPASGQPVANHPSTKPVLSQTTAPNTGSPFAEPTAPTQNVAATGGNPFATGNPYVAPVNHPRQSSYSDHNPPPLGLITVPMIIAGVIYIILGVGFSLLMFMIPNRDPGAGIAYVFFLLFGLFSVALGAFCILIAGKVKQRKKWAWIAAIVFGGMFTPSAFFFLGIPILIGCLKPEVSGWINDK